MPAAEHSSRLAIQKFDEKHDGGGRKTEGGAEMNHATGPKWTIGISALVIAILALAVVVYLLFQWQWIGRP